MKSILGMAAAVILAAVPLTASAQQEDPNRPPRSGSLTQDFKNDARQAGSEIKGDANKVSTSAKNKTAKAKKKAAVAQCSDGVYSYTRKNTCSKHGGIKTRYKQ